jgi:hypothetical protein
MPRTRQGSPTRPSTDEIGGLKMELASRIAECDWLKSHYEQHLRAAFSRIQDLRTAPPATNEPVVDVARYEAELRQLRLETERLRSAEQRYLDRIAELKEDLSAQRSDRANPS